MIAPSMSQNSETTRECPLFLVVDRDQVIASFHDLAEAEELLAKLNRRSLKIVPDHRQFDERESIAPRTGPRAIDRLFSRSQ
jgi:hypothetical protein